MSTVVQFIIAFIILDIGVCIGFAAHKWLLYRSSYDGVMLVIQDEDKLLYSLELHEDVEQIQYKNELILKVKPLEEELFGRK